MALYYLETRLRLEEDTHIEQVVLYLGKEPLRMRSVIETPSMRFQFRLIDIGEVDGDVLAASGDLGDVMLAVLARVTSRQEAIRRALDRIAKLKRRAGSCGRTACDPGRAVGTGTGARERSEGVYAIRG